MTDPDRTSDLRARAERVRSEIRKAERCDADASIFEEVAVSLLTP